MRKRARLATAGCCTEVCIDPALDLQEATLVLRQQARALSVDEIREALNT